MLEAKDVNTYYGTIHALKGVNLRIGHGDLVCIIGANGAGKTTLLKSICGLLTIRSGTKIYQGKDITNLSTAQIVKEGICLVPEGRQIFGHLNVYDNLVLGAYLHRKRRYRREIEERMEQVLRVFPILKDRERQIAGTLSGGEQQMLAIGRALMSKPKLLLLDEPSLGIAPLVVKELFIVIKELHQGGTTALLVEQNARAALKTAQYGYVLETGYLSLEGKTEDLLTHDSVKKAYLGG